MRAALSVDLRQPLAQPRVAGRVAEVAGEIEQIGREALPLHRIGVAAQLVAKVLVIPWLDRVADYVERLRQHALGGQAHERGHQLAVRQVTGRAEDNHGTRIRRAGHTARRLNVGHGGSYLWVWRTFCGAIEIAL